MVQRDLKNPYKANVSPIVYLRDMQVNVETMKVKFYKKHAGIPAEKELNLVRDEHNERCRCHESTKGYREQFNIK